MMEVSETLLIQKQTLFRYRIVMKNCQKKKNVGKKYNLQQYYKGLKKITYEVRNMLVVESQR